MQAHCRLVLSRSALAAIPFALSLAFPVSEVAAKADSYSTLIYDFEVALICGLADQGLYDAYMSRRQSIEASDGRDEAALTAARIKAMAAADREYQNRSLGGHKQWCATEGQDGVRRIHE